MKLYRIVVDHWPTDDGKPWPHLVLPKLAADCEPWEQAHGIQPWMLTLIEHSDTEGWWGMEAFQKWEGLPVGATPDDPWDWRDGRPPDFLGWILPTPWAGPKIKRGFWMSRARALDWIAAAAEWGARAHLVVSKPIEWEEHAGGH